MTDISPLELQARRRQEPVVIVDVREPWEYAHCHIDGAVLIPLQTLPEASPSLSRSALTVMVCHHGMRSAAAADYLRDAGFEQVLNLSGGIDRWSRDVDPTVPRY